MTKQSGIRNQVTGVRLVGGRPRHQMRAKRYPPTAMVFPTGRCELSTLAREAHDRQAALKGLTTGHQIALGISEAEGVVVVYAIAANTPGAIQGRRLKSGQLSFSIDELLDEVPTLRPETRVKCSVTEAVDDKGEPCLVIGLGAQLPHIKRPNQESAKPAKSGQEAQAAQKKS